MTRPIAVFPIALALVATILVPETSAREPTPIKACQTISKPGSYELANNLTATGDCLVITADFVTIDLAGFLISGAPNTGAGIRVAPEIVGHPLEGIAVRNGSISGFGTAVDLRIGLGPQIVDGLRVRGAGSEGILAEGIVKGNTVTGVGGIGIVARGTVTGNYAATNGDGFDIASGSTVIGNTAIDNRRFGFEVGCPSNLTDNTAVNNGTNLETFDSEGCRIEGNVGF
jgi:hypothetical protein